MKPGAERTGPAYGWRGGPHQAPAQQAIAFLGDVAGADPPRTPTHPRRQADVAGNAFGAREALDVAELEHEDNRDEGAGAMAALVAEGQQALRNLGYVER